MAYTITLTDGTVLTTIANNTVDTSTSLILVGRNFAGYGGYVAENFVYLLENFANVTPPSAPLIGQIYYNKSTSNLQVWDGAAWDNVGFSAGGGVTGNVTIDGSLEIDDGTLTMYNSAGPTNNRKWRVLVANSGDLQLESLNDNNSLNTLVMDAQTNGAITFEGAVTVQGNTTLNGNVAMTGTSTAPTVVYPDNSTNIATTAYVTAAVSGVRFQLNSSARTGTTTNGSGVISGLASTAGILAGMNVAGTGIPAGAVVVSVISSSSFSISQNATASGTVTLYTGGVTPTGNVTAGSPTVTGLSSTAGIVVGMTVVGSAIVGSNTTVTVQSIDSSSQITLTANASATIAGVTLVIGGELNVYVATTGSDTNPGSFGSPFATLQRAWNYVAQSIDLGGRYWVKVNVANGTYTTGVNCLGAPVGFGTNVVQVSFVGSGASNVSVTLAGIGTCFYVALGALIGVHGMKLTAANGSTNYPSNCIGVGALGAMNISGVNFGAAYFAHIDVGQNGNFSSVGPYTISGSAQYHLYAVSTGFASISAVVGGTAVVTLTGTPAFSAAFAGTDGGTIYVPSTQISYSGSATGTRYLASDGGVISTAGGGASFFPGNSAGSSSTGYYS